MDCKHLNIKVDAKVARLVEKKGDEIPSGYCMDITVHCTDCMKPFEFIGLPNGFSFNTPTVSIEGIEARMPIKPIH